MRNLVKIAWRNLWRNKLRSMVVIGSITIGIWSGIFINGFSYGINTQRTASAIETNIAHLQIHHPEWNKEPQPEFIIPNGAAIEKTLRNDTSIGAISPRTLVYGMIASANGSQGIQLAGIHPEAEAQVSGLEERLDTGAYFAGPRKNQIVIGTALAEALKVRLGSKIVLTFTDLEGNIISAAFRVMGTYHNISSQLEKSIAFVKIEDLQSLLNTDGIHEIAIMTAGGTSTVDSVKEQLQSKLSDVFVQSWKDIAPELAFADELMTLTFYIIIGIIMLALSFGIINTMLMAILERQRELGMLMAIGMNKMRLFVMIMIETVMLALCGGPLGILLGFITIEQTAKTGIDLSIFAQGLESFGISTLIYPEIETPLYFGTAALVTAMTLLASLYPARRALKLNPIQAIRKS